MMLLSGTTILASNRRSIDAIKKQIDPDFRLTLNNRDQGFPTYSATTDKDGKATLSDIPLKLQFHVGAYHDDYILPEGGNGRRQRVPFKCDSTEPVPVMIKMKAIEKGE